MRSQRRASLSPFACVKILGKSTSVSDADGLAYMVVAQISVAYPPVDKDVRNHLLAAPSAEQESECKGYLRAFMSSLFTEAQATILDLAKGTAHGLEYEELARRLYEFFSEKSTRDNFYSTVVRKASFFDDRPLQHPLQSLLGTLTKICSDWDETISTTCCPIVQSMDEVHILFEPRTQDPQPGHTLYSRFKSILSEIRGEAFCVVFLSTASSISGLAPSKDVAPSMRERSDDLALTTPFTELPFDVDLLSQPLVPQQESLESVCSLQFITQFGRPLYVPPSC